MTRKHWFLAVALALTEATFLWASADCVVDHGPVVTDPDNCVCMYTPSSSACPTPQCIYNADGGQNCYYYHTGMLVGGVWTGEFTYENTYCYDVTSSVPVFPPLCDGQPYTIAHVSTSIFDCFTEFDYIYGATGILHFTPILLTVVHPDSICRGAGYQVHVQATQGRMDRSAGVVTTLSYNGSVICTGTGEYPNLAVPYLGVGSHTLQLHSHVDGCGCLFADSDGEITVLDSDCPPAWTPQMVTNASQKQRSPTDPPSSCNAP